MNYRIIYIALIITMMLACVIKKNVQYGGDPYAFIRPGIILDMFRTFWLTR
uniref:Lipoprotein n=1 Tax=viral metagenome TaxID=1070528 RepID=A0A6C0J5K6_9ZZZZ